MDTCHQGPEHVAIVMDGNRRWAKARGLPAIFGHRKGAQSLVELVRIAPELGVRVLTVYAFSTENWKRSTKEVQSLMSLFEKYLRKEKQRMIKKGVRLKTIGDLEKLSPVTKALFLEIEEATKEGQTFTLVLAINYGGRDEICRAVRRMLRDEVKLPLEEITEEKLASYLDTGFCKDPDLLIRTSGEHRLSNFLLWQVSYTEIYVTETLWPDFAKNDLEKAIAFYQSRTRRWGA